MQMKKDPAGGGTQVGNVLQLSLSKRIFYKKLHFRTNAVILQRQAQKNGLSEISGWIHDLESPTIRALEK